MINNFLQRYLLPIVMFFWGLAVFLFWQCGYPQALSYQEQCQLFLWTGDYFVHRCVVPDGLSAYVGELLTQFFYVGWLGAIIYSVLSMALLGTVALLIRTKGAPISWLSVVFSLSVPLLLLTIQGDENFLPTYEVALLIALIASLGRHSVLWDAIVLPLLYLAIGPMSWVYVLLRVFSQGWKTAWRIAYLLLLQFVAYWLLLPQTPLTEALLGIDYYRIPLSLFLPWQLWAFPLVVTILILLGRCVIAKGTRIQKRCVTFAFPVLSLLALSFGGQYDKDKYEMLMQDYLLRNERWADVVSRAEKYQPQTAFSSNAVNLALGMTRQLADRQFSFYQSGEDGLISPASNNLVEGLPAAEAFFRLGLINSALRYTFDAQNSILNGRKSGRLCKRLAECYLINGRYQVARKYLDLLKNTVFYRQWAIEKTAYLNKDAMVQSDPVLGPLCRYRLKSNFLYNYPEIDKIFGQLFVGNPSNKLALDYFMAQMLLKGNIQGFVNYMPWVQQYGDYAQMPVGYEDAMQAIQSHGQDGSSRYAAYVKRMMQTPSAAQ